MVLSRIVVLAQAAPPDPCAGTGSALLCRFLADRGLGQVAGIVATVVPVLLRILLILVVIAVGNRLARRFVKRFFATLGSRGRSQAPLRATSKSRAMRANTVGGVFSNIATIVLFAMAFVLALDELGVQIGPLIAGAGIIGLALAFGATSIVRDSLAGVFILLEDQFGVGDVVTLGSGPYAITGEVEAMTLRITQVRQWKGELSYVPNGEIRTVSNKSRDWNSACLEVGVAYDSDVDHAVAVVQRVADSLWQDEEWSTSIFTEQPPVAWGLSKFEPNQMTISVFGKVKPCKDDSVCCELRARIKKAFEEEGIEIPFPAANDVDQLA